MNDSPLQAIQASLPAEYSILEPIDRGGQGTVFRGHYAATPVAIKVFRPDADLRRIERELQLLTQLDCPHLVKIVAHHHITLHGQSTTVVAYELLGAGDLRTIEHPADLETICDVGEQISIAIDLLWKSRIVHRDIKPANIVRANDGRFVLVDFGLARHLDLSSITAPFAAPGTPGYMSPEQAMGRKHLTVHSDIFSLGITLYELATRQHPFRRQQHLIGKQAPRDIALLRPDLPHTLAHLITRMLSPSPADRPFRDIAHQFHHIRED
jgi:serine/threonine protein kinase